MTNECYIGLWHNYEDSELCTYDGLKRRLADKEETDRYWAKDPLYSQIHTPWKWTLQDYLDMRKTVNMTRFHYCPWCGKKIDWAAMRKELRA